MLALSNGGDPFIEGTAAQITQPGDAAQEGA
jgi:hypothetical protein